MNDRTTIGHPAPHRDRVAWSTILAALVLAPIAWYLQLNASFLLGGFGCADATAPGHPAAHTAITGLGLVAAVLAVLALAQAMRAWSRTKAEGPGRHHTALTAGLGRTRFLALSGFIVSGLFVVAVGFALLALLLVHACHP
jgi:hypothetical protein